MNDLEDRVMKAESEVNRKEKEKEEAIAQALKDGEAKAEKVCAIKEAAVKKDAEWQKKIADEKISNLQIAVDHKDEEIDSLKAKLDEAYTRIQNMAIAQSNANGRTIPQETTK